MSGTKKALRIRDFQKNHDLKITAALVVAAFSSPPQKRILQKKAITEALRLDKKSGEAEILPDRVVITCASQQYEIWPNGLVSRTYLAD